MLRMKRLRFFFIFILLVTLPQLMQAEAREIKVSPAIHSVTIMSGQAMVTRNFQRTFQPGRYTVKFTNFPADLLDDSVRVSGKGTAGAMILDVNVSSDYLAETRPDHVRSLQIQIIDTGKKIKALEDELDAIEIKEKLLNTLTGKTTDAMAHKKEVQTPSLELWKSSLDFVELQVTDIYKRKRAIGKRKKSLEAQQRVLGQKYRNVNSGHKKETKYVEVDIDVKNPGPFNMEVSYFIPRASWTPVYDVRIPLEGGSGGLTYSAMVNQKTGEDWDNVYLTLSTTKPAKFKNIPQLSPVFVSGRKPVQKEVLNSGIAGTTVTEDGSTVPGVLVTATSNSRPDITAVSNENGKYRLCMPTGVYSVRFELTGFRTQYRNGVEVRRNAFGIIDTVMETPSLKESVSTGSPVSKYLSPGKVGSGYDSGYDDEDGEVEDILDFLLETPSTEVAAQEISAEFKVKQTNSFKSSSDSQKVTIATLRLPAEKEFIAYPKLSDKVYLKAELKNTSEYPLMPGRMNVFYGDALVNKSRMRQLNPGESMDVPVGIDEAVTVKRVTRQSASDDKGVIKKKVVRSSQYKIIVENQRQKQAVITVVDQLPVSTSKKILVKSTKITPTPLKDKKLEKDGFLKWKLTLKPGQKKEIHVQYSVEYPGNLKVLERQ